MAKYEFVNPYNFIPLNSQEPVRVNKEQIKGSYTGKIKYRLLTKTPLFIPNTSRDDAFLESRSTADHKSFDFFSYQDLSEINETLENKHFEPVIPGSEIRGMLRANYEILTNSCMSAIDDDVILSKRTQEKFKAGLIKRIPGDSEVTYELYAAEDCLMRTMGENSIQDDRNWKDDTEHNKRKCYKQENLKEGQKVLFDLSRREGKGVKPLALNVTHGRNIGYVIKGEEGPELANKQNKHCCHVFCCKGGAIKQLSVAEIKALSSVLKCYKDNGQNTYEEYSKAWESFRAGKAEEMFPVYYSFEDDQNQFVFLSSACITREIYRNKLSQMIKGHQCCGNTGKKELCPSCAIFGTLGKEIQNTSRVRVADLRLCSKDSARFSYKPSEVFMEKVTCKPLGSPKISNMEFYVKRPKNAWFWTYDYYFTNDGKVKLYMPEINGRKFYWHQMNPQLMKGEVPSNQNATIRPVKENICFEGEIYFNDLTKDELDKLIYVVNAGDDRDISQKTHGYKVGHAKPLGLGSVALSVDQVLLRKISLDIERRCVAFHELTYIGECHEESGLEKSSESWSEPEINKEIKSDFQIMTDFHYLDGKNVDYPRTRADEGDIFEWFVKNHSGYRLDKKSNQRIKAPMPVDRGHMLFLEYMEPVNPTLKETGAQKMFESHNDRVGEFAQSEGERFGRPRIGNGINAQIGKMGTIIRYDLDKKYGFVKLDDGNEIYFKQSAIKNLGDLRGQTIKPGMLLVNVETMISEVNGKDAVKRCNIKCN